MMCQKQKRWKIKKEEREWEWVTVCQKWGGAGVDTIIIIITCPVSYFGPVVLFSLNGAFHIFGCPGQTQNGFRFETSSGLSSHDVVRLWWQFVCVTKIRTSRTCITTCAPTCSRSFRSIGIQSCYRPAKSGAKALFLVCRLNRHRNDCRAVW